MHTLHEPDELHCVCGMALDIRPRWGATESGHAGSWKWFHRDGTTLADHTPRPARPGDAHLRSGDRPVVASTMSARQQLVAVLRWARAAGWHRRAGWGWCTPAGDAAVEVLDGELVVRDATRPAFPGQASYHPVTTIREGIEQLVTLGLLPPEVSPVYASGYGAGWRAAQLRQDTAVAGLAARCGDLVQLLSDVQVAAWCLAPGDPAAQLRAVRDRLAAAGMGDPATELVAAHHEVGLTVGGAR